METNTTLAHKTHYYAVSVSIFVGLTLECKYSQ